MSYAEAFNFIIFLLLLLAVIAGAIFFFFFLLNKENKCWGLALHFMSLSISLIFVLGMAVFIQPATLTLTEFIDGELVTTVINEGTDREAISGAIGAVIYTFIFMNIPTVTLLFIYKLVRGNQNRNRDVEKMRVQDL
jgi:hypothetical protein